MIAGPTCSPHTIPVQAHNTLEYAKSSLEWMNESLTRSLGHTRDNPFNTRCA